MQKKYQENQIISDVHQFIKNCVAKDDFTSLEAHGVTQDRFDILKDSKHPGNGAIEEEVFHKLMEDIGYYDALNNISLMTQLTPTTILQKLTNPDKRTIKPMRSNTIIYGVTKTLSFIDSFDSATKCDCMLPSINQTNSFENKDNEYSTDVTINMGRGDFSYLQKSLDNHEIQIGGNTYILPENGCHIDYSTQLIPLVSKAKIYFDELYSSTLKTNEKYYLRYITEIPIDHQGLTLNIAKHLIRIDGYRDIDSIHFKIDMDNFYLYSIKYNNKKFLVIDVESKKTYSDITGLSFTILTAYAMFSENMYLNRCWIVASNDNSFQIPIGLYYRKLRPSFSCGPSIFTTNVFSVLNTIGNNIYEGTNINGVDRAKDLIIKLHLANAIEILSEETFENIINNFIKYKKLQLGVYIILLGSNTSLEVMPGLNYIALETISNLSRDILHQKSSLIIEKNDWKVISHKIESFIESLHKENFISFTEQEELKKKIDSMNRPTNTSKLSILWKYYNYPLSAFDEDFFKKRNIFLHGNYDFTSRNFYEISRDLQLISFEIRTFCLSLVLLISDYNGYIINLPRLYGLTNKGTGFIRIPKKLLTKISILVPIYNSEKYLKKCLDSILNQTFVDFEVILVDDGSTDSSGDICDKYAKKDSRFKVFHKKNEGISATREFAIQHAKGKYIQFVDSDDWIEQDMLEKMYKEARKENLDIVGCNFIEEYKDHQAGNRVYYTKKDDFIKDIISNKWGVLWKLLIKKSIIIDNKIHFPKDINGGEDYFFVTNVAIKSNKVGFLDSYFYHYYRGNENSFITKDSLNKALYQVKATEMVNDLLKANSLERRYSKEILRRKAVIKSQVMKNSFCQGIRIFPEADKAYHNSKLPRKIRLNLFLSYMINKIKL